MRVVEPASREGGAIFRLVSEGKMDLVEASGMRKQVRWSEQRDHRQSGLIRAQDNPICSGGFGSRISQGGR